MHGQALMSPCTLRPQPMLVVARKSAAAAMRVCRSRHGTRPAAGVVTGVSLVTGALGKMHDAVGLIAVLTALEGATIVSMVANGTTTATTTTNATAGVLRGLSGIVAAASTTAAALSRTTQAAALTQAVSTVSGAAELRNARV